MKRFFLALLLLTLLIGCDFFDESDYEGEDDFSPPPVSDVVEPDDEDEDDAPPPPSSIVGDSLSRDFALPIPLFAPDSAWNQTAVNAAVLPQSDQQILVTFRVLLGDFSDLEGYDEPATEWPYMDINIDDYSVPIFRAGDGMLDVVICADEGVLGWPHPKFGIETEGDPVPVPVPAVNVRPAGPEDEDADGHMVLYNPATFMAYDLFATTLEGQGDCNSFRGGMTGQQITEVGEVDFFDVQGPGVNADGLSSARAHGTPLLAGLILPEDIESGVIAHALSLAIPGPRNLSRDPYEPLASDCFYPASTTETDFYSTNSNALAAGQRLRLKQTLVDEEGDLTDESELAPITQIFLTTLRDYGAYVVDNAGGFSFYAEDVHTAVLHLSDDEVNALIGEPSGTPLPEDMTKWEIVLEKLGEELELIPFAISAGDEEPDPETAVIEASNFEVVETAVRP
ncbi:MAG: hypothetical protein GY805_18980 [Chloroflexi bacterium]|nr:hypothetical protein [Chloroflexota bacterium]